MVSVLLLLGLLVAAFVGFNIGGSSTGVAFGPAVGSEIVSKSSAAALMTVFAFAGGWFSGRNVIQTLGGDIVPASYFTLLASVTILLFVGLALLVSNLFGVPASTSMTAVGAIAGMGLARQALQWNVMGQIMVWWLAAPLLGFWICTMIGRYFYPYLDARFALESATGLKRTVTQSLVVAIGCYMAYSAGASNVANAVAPLVAGGTGQITASQGVFLAGGAIAVGAFTIARRTLDTVGTGLTDLPLLAALIVETVSASLITFLSELGIPASLAVSATMCIIGLGWGRATRTSRLLDVATTAVDGSSTAETVQPGVDSLTTHDDEVQPIGEEEPDEQSAGDLFDAAATGRVVILWLATPTLAAVGSFVVFSLVLT
ncbi:inorganic phosphate transporter [Halobacteriales archaeon QH_7_65_31]|nr:MAG: inorganic phosphate transporter [Halobacteriales archaeon QH_7_65_31]